MIAHHRFAADSARNASRRRQVEFDFSGAAAGVAQVARRGPADAL